MPSRGAAHFGRNTRTGLDVLVEQRFQPLAGKRVGLITNQTGVDRAGPAQRGPHAAGGHRRGGAVLAGARPRWAVEDRPGIEDSTDRRYRHQSVQPLRQDAAANPGNAARDRRAGVRHSKRGRALLHLRNHHGLRHGSRSQGRDSVLRAGPAESHHRPTRGGAAAGQRQPILRGVFRRHAGAPWHDHGRVGQVLSTPRRRLARRSR